MTGPLPSPGAVLRTTFTTTTDASISAGSRFFLQYTGGPPNSTDLNTLATAVATSWNTSIAPHAPSNDALTEVTIEDLSSDTGATGTWTGSHVGSGTGAVLAASIAACVNHQINRRYRGGHPKTFLRIGSVNDLNGTNQWAAGSITTFLSAWEAFIADIVATTGLSITISNIVNVSYFKGFTVFDTPGGRAKNISTLRETPVVDQITGSSIAPKLGSQRRRLNV